MVDSSFIHCQMNANSAASGTIAGVLLSSAATRILFQDCQANNNGPASAAAVSVFGYSVGGTDIIFRDCIASGNKNGTTETTGFKFDTVTKAMVDSCIASDNTGAGPVNGFSLVSTGTSCLLNSLAKRNRSSGGTATGINLSSCSNCSVEKNIVKNNTGTTSQGIVDSSGTHNVFFNNEVQGHGTSGASNFVTVLAPIATYDPSIGEFTSTLTAITAFDNISVTMP